MAWSKAIAWTLMTVLAFLVGVYALGFFLVDELGGADFKERFESVPFSARLHIIPGGLALILGAFQFHGGLRRRWTGLHRRCGQAYVVFVLLAAIGGMLLAWYAPQSPATRLGFGTLGVVWFYSCCLAYVAARARNFELHRQWMIRCYALTLAAVTLRIQLGLYQGAFGLSFEESYAIVAWFCWIPNLVVAEWFIIQAPIRRSRSVASEAVS